MEKPQPNFLFSTSTIDAGNRITSALVDWFVMGGIAMPFSIPYFIYSFSQPLSNKMPGGITLYIALIGFALFFCKDCIQGQSIGKRLLKQQVINNKTGQIASSLRCFVRDVFMILWPIEGIMTLINPNRRLGDFVAGTKVVVYDPMLEKPLLNYPQLILCFAISYILMMSITFIFP